ncbi:MAG: hypothetical protein KAF40_04305 [Flavihumibacter sp.]|nr:hypothetical protein [Flavihumibacter sp.]
MAIGYLFQIFYKAILFRAREENIILQDLLNKFTYRYVESQRSSFSILFIFARIAIKNCFYPAYIKDDTVAKVATSLVFDSKYEKENRDRYLAYLSIGPYAYLSRNHCFFRLPFYKSLSISIQLLLLFPFLLLMALFRKNRGNLGLLSLELVEASLLISQVKKMPMLRKVYLFSAYEKDCSFLSYILMRKFKLEVQLVPSSNPLRIHYKKGVCTTLTFTTAYHPAEFEKIKSNWVYTNTENWPPFGYEEVIPRLATYDEPPPCTIGYFSSGNWLREKLGRLSYVPFEREAEKMLMQHLHTYLAKHPGFSLIIFLHPLEKRGEQRLVESENYYRSYFGADVQFAPFDTNSVSCFDLVDIGIAIYSSTIFQRLFAGQKSLFAPYSMQADYFTDKTIEAISIRSYEQLEFLIQETAKQSPAEYFSRYKLQDYTWKSFSKLVKPAMPTA